MFGYVKRWMDAPSDERSDFFIFITILSVLLSAIGTSVTGDWMFLFIILLPIAAALAFSVVAAMLKALFLLISFIAATSQMIQEVVFAKLFS